MEGKAQDPAPGTVGLNEHGHLIDIGTRAKWLRRQALFEASPDPTCSVCTERVETADDSVLFAPIGKPEVLVHHGPCFHQALMVSVTHYMENVALDPPVMTAQEGDDVWRCLYCHTRVWQGEDCANPVCQGAFRRAQRRMGVTS